MSDDVVQLTVASSESEAAMICGYLEARGIHATYDKGGVFQPFYYGGGGTGEAYLGRQLRYGRAGRPEHRYVWRAT